MKTRSTKLHLLDEHLIAIGHVAIRGQQLDSSIQRLLIDLAGGLPQRMGVFLSNLPERNHITLLSDVLTASFPEEATDIEGLIKRIHGVRTERNDIIHAGWNPSGDGESVNLVKPGDPRMVKREKLTGKHINNIAERIFEVSQEVNEWWNRCLETQPSFGMWRLGNSP